MSAGLRPPQPSPMIAWPGTRPVVWAPDARTVEVVADGPDGPVAQHLRLIGAQLPGYWGADSELAYGTRFGFRVDGGDVVADPTGTWFPEGVHGLSRVLEPPTGWTDDGWRPPDVGAGVMLHLDIPTATPEGTLDAATALLPRIAASGVQGVELAPVAAFDPDAGPRAGVRLFAVHEPYGGVDALARFVDAAHAAGLAVVLTPPYRWGVARWLGLETFGRYAVAGRLNLEASGNRGVRDFLTSDAERWFRELHIDALSLDVEALADRSPVPYLAELADEAVAGAERLGRTLTLFIDGPGRSDRLTAALQILLGPSRTPDPVAVDHLRRLARTLSPAARLPLRVDRWVRRSHPATLRGASVVVGDLTRLPGARRGMPWAPQDEPQAPGDLDTRAGMLTFAMLVGTPLVLDTDHVPVTRGGEDAERLVAWCAALAELRAEAAPEVALGVDIHVYGAALLLRRGRHAVVLAAADDATVPLDDVLPGGPGAWELAARWSPLAALDGDRLVVPARTTAVLRARV